MRFLPPLVIEKDDLQQVVQVVQEVLSHPLDEKSS
jgi:acetylornithine/succinyldiaminopimelate/putrescine aminotransferase